MFRNAHSGSDALVCQKKGLISKISLLHSTLGRRAASKSAICQLLAPNTNLSLFCSVRMHIVSRILLTNDPSMVQMRNRAKGQ